MANNFAFEEEPIASHLNTNVWIKVIKFAWKYWYMFLFLLLFVFITAVFDTSVTPILNRAAIESVSTQAGVVTDVFNVSMHINFWGISFNVSFGVYLIFLVVSLLLRAGLIFGTFFLTGFLEMAITVELRRASFGQVQKLSFSYFDRNSSGWLIARMQNDTAKISEVLSWGIIRLIWALFELVVTIITMFTMDWRLSLIIIASTPAIIIISPIFEKTVLKLARIARHAYSGFVRWLAECINGSKTIKTLGIEETTYEEAEEIVDDIRIKYFRRQRFQSLFQPSINIISAVTTAAVIYFGFQYLPTDGSGLKDMGLLVAFIGFVSAIYFPLMDGAEIFSDVMATQASVEKLLSLIEEPPAIVDKPEVVEKYGSLLEPKYENYQPMAGKIRFENVSFSYVKDTEVIHDFNLEIPVGQSVAIVGETGSGKSTTVNLICRFYEPSEGKIYIDDVEYRDMSVGYLRSNIGYVQQTPFIFSGTIADNIRYGRLNATEEDIIQAAVAVELDQYVNTLPDKYNTVLKDGGAGLSLGQKQLISFARALIRNPKIMILDEATSSIDTETEAYIQSGIRTVLKGRTSIIIAHRLSTIVDCDRILLLDDGRIIEDGSHSELMQKHGAYHRLYMNQFKDLQVDEQIDKYEKQIKDIV